MSTEKYDKELRQKLEGMNEVPVCYSFKPATIWQQLESQLQPRQAKKKMVWLYWAAACLLLAIGIMMFISTSKKLGNHFVQASSQNKNAEPKLILSDAIAPVQKTIPAIDKVVKGSASSKKLIADLPTANDAKAPQELLADSVKHEQVATIQESINGIPANKINSNAAIAIPVKIIAAAAPKTRLKVVHINELDAPPLPIIAKADTKKQLLQQTDDPTDTEPSKPFWQKKPKQLGTSTSSFIDNQ